jgi:release factor glutamine methyltransferase
VPSPEHDAKVLAELADQTGEDLDVLGARRARREPLQHLTGKAYFRYATLEVGPGVFTPRPETEVLAGWAIERAAELVSTRSGSVGRDSTSVTVVDLCTGSGAIALSVATEVPGSKVYAVELGDEAVEYARRNLQGRGVELRHGDMADAFPELDGAVDIVVSNPPYIPLEAFESVAPEARDYDPALALWSGQDGLDAMKIVERVAARLLRSGGAVAVEHADVQGESVPAIFTATGRWTEVRDHEDLAGRSRFTTARLAR